MKSKELLVARMQREAEMEQTEARVLPLIQQKQTKVLKEDQDWWIPGPEEGIRLENS